MEKRIKYFILCAAAISVVLLVLPLVKHIYVQKTATCLADFPSDVMEQIERAGKLPLRPGLKPDQKLTCNIVLGDLRTYSELTGRREWPSNNFVAEKMDALLAGRLSQWHWVKPSPSPVGIQYHADGDISASELKEDAERIYRKLDILIVPEGTKYFRALPNSGLNEPNWKFTAARRLLEIKDRAALPYRLAGIIGILTTTAVLLITLRKSLAAASKPFCATVEPSCSTAA